MRYISILVGSAGGENPADNVTSSLFAWWEWVWYGGRVSPSFRAWNGNTFTHKQTQTFWRTYCHVHNFKFDTALQVICFAHFLYHSVHNNFIFGSCVCTSVSRGWQEYVRSILCVHLFRLCLYTVRIMHSSAMVCHGMRLKYVAGVHEYATAIDGDIMRFYIHIFCKTNENILMSSLNIT